MSQWARMGESAAAFWEPAQEVAAQVGAAKEKAALEAGAKQRTATSAARRAANSKVVIPRPGQV